MARIPALAFLLLTGIAPGYAQSTFHGDVARTGVYASSGPVNPPSVQWRFRAAGPVVTSPAIADGVVYIGSLTDTCTRSTSRPARRSGSSSRACRSPLLPPSRGGTVYFVSSAGSLAALDAATGQPEVGLRRTNTKGSSRRKGLHGYPPAAQTIPDAWDVFTSSPAVANGKVYFGSGDGNVYAVDAGDRRAAVEVPDRRTSCTPRRRSRTAWSTSAAGTATSTRSTPRPAQQKWSFAGGQDPAIHNQVGFQSSPAVVDGTVYVGCRDAHVYALDAATGRKKWDYPTSKSWVIGTPAVRDGIVYVGTSDSARFMALDAKTGRLRFNFDAKAYIFSSAALAGGPRLLRQSQRQAVRRRRQDRQLAWEFQTEASKTDPLKVLNPDGSLNQAAFAPVFGDFQDMYLDFYRFVSIGAIMSSPVVDQGAVYFGSMDGFVYALR